MDIDGPFGYEIEPLKRTNISELIIEEITEYLTSGKLKPGDKLPTEQEFATIYKVGRNSIREAMRVLISLGIAEIRRGQGTFIRTSPSGSLLNPLVLALVLQQGSSKELVDLRVAIETAAVELAIDNATDEEIDRLERSNRKLKEAASDSITDPDRLRELDIDVHFTLFDITHNELFARIAKTVYKLFFASLERVIELDLRNSYDNHEKYITAIQQRDPDLARTKVKEGLSFWRNYVAAQNGNPEQ